MLPLLADMRAHVPAGNRAATRILSATSPPTHMIRLLSTTPLLGAILASSGAVFAQTSFTPIPNASGQAASNGNGCYVNSQPRLSADGSTVGFTSYIGGISSGAVPYDYAVWTQSGGTEVIAPSSSYGANFGWGIWGLSGDGTLACGSNWIWRRVGGYQSLDSTLNAQFPSVGYSSIFGCSQDGSVLVGLREGTVGIPISGDYFRWQFPQGAPQLLPRNPQYPEGYFIFNCVSGDGSVIGGQTYAADATYGQVYAAALVTPTGSTLLTPQSQGNATMVRDLSFNGSVAVGQVSLGGPLGVFGMESFRWSAAGGLQVLPTPGTTSSAIACDSSGDTIVGTYLSFGTAGTRAYVWRAGSGAIDLQDELTNTYGLGSALQGWTLLSADDVSADGNVIVGTARNPSGCEQAYLVRFPLPGPATYCTAGTTSNGCNASIAASAQPSASQATPCTLSVSSVEGQKQGLLFYGLDNTGFTPLPWAATSSSFFCVKSPTQRTFPQNSGGAINQCNGLLTVDLNNFFVVFPSAIGLPFSAGDKLFVQAWFRDPPAPRTTNLSNAIEMTMQP